MFRTASRLVVYGLVLATLAFFCSLMFFGGSGFNRLGDFLEETMFLENPEAVATESASMLGFVIPSGYSGEGIVDFFFGKTLILTSSPLFEGDYSRPDIFIATFPDGTQLDPDQVRRWAETSLRGGLPFGENQARRVDQRLVTVNGQLVTFFIYEGVDDEGIAFRQLISQPFRARTGEGTIVIMGPIPGWDDEAINGFLNSLQ